MAIVVRAPVWLRRRELRLGVDGAVTLREVARRAVEAAPDELGGLFDACFAPDAGIGLYINGRLAPDPDCRVGDADEVLILPLVTGG